MAIKISRRTIDAAEVRDKPYFIWDSELKGFGIAISALGLKTYVVKYRVGKGRGASVRRVTICDIGKLTPDEARAEAKNYISNGILGVDLAASRKSQQLSVTVNDLADVFITHHVNKKKKQTTIASYTANVNKHIRSGLGRTRIDELTRSQISNWHFQLNETPYAANTALTILRVMFSFGHKHGIIPEHINPAKSIAKNIEETRERYLIKDELLALGNTLRLAETEGLPWKVNDNKKNKHRAKTNNTTKIDPYALAALRLLIFTGARMREILHLKWDYIDFERGIILLPDSKTGKKTIILNAPAMALLSSIDRIDGCHYVIYSGNKEKPKSGLKKPWSSIIRNAKLDGVRIHDLRHTFASYGAGAGLGLPIVGKLLGHSQSSTTERYAHLDNDPLRRGTNIIGNEIASAMGEKMHSAEIIELKR